MLVHEGHASAKKFFTPANAESYDAVARLATFGRDSAWKCRIIDELGDRASVLELACGTGILSSMLAEAGKRVVGVDLTLEYLRASRGNLRSFAAQGTAEILPYRSGSFDAVASSYLAKYVDIESVVDECWRVLTPGGIVVFHDFSYPAGVMRRLWKAHFALLRIAGVFAKSWSTVFEELDRVIEESDWAVQTQNSLRNRGFCNIKCIFLTAGTAAIVSAERP